MLKHSRIHSKTKRNSNNSAREYGNLQTAVGIASFDIVVFSRQIFTFGGQITTRSSPRRAISPSMDFVNLHNSFTANFTSSILTSARGVTLRINTLPEPTSFLIRSTPLNCVLFSNSIQRDIFNQVKLNCNLEQKRFDFIKGFTGE